MTLCCVTGQWGAGESRHVSATYGVVIRDAHVVGWSDAELDTRQHPGAARGQQTQARSIDRPDDGRVVKVNVWGIGRSRRCIDGEAMKMEHSVRAAWAGQVSELQAGRPG